MKVKKAINTMTNNGTRKVFNDKTKMYVPNQKCWNEEVKRISYHKGYGYKQVNAVIHIYA